MEKERNNTNFPLYTYERLKSKKFTPNDLEMYHQFLVRQYMIDNPYVRGILAFHTYGSGKTRLGANNIRELMNERQIVVIAPTSVFGKFRDEFREVGVDTNNVNFISLKASNLGAQIERLEGFEMDVEGDPSDIIRKTSLDNTFLVIDEAHNFFNAIINGSKNAVDLYDSIMAAKNLKLLFLSGSPIVNTPFELVPCFNMLAGHKLFSENQEDFEKYFVSDDGLHVQNTDKFKNRIFGLVSYFGEWIQAVTRTDRPKRLPTKVIRVPMSEKQYAVYSTYRDKEREESSGTFRKRHAAERFAPKTSSSSYRIKSRQACNFVIDPKARDRGVSDPERCPKFIRAMEIVEQHKRQPGMFYSNFVNVAGLTDFAAMLSLHGWEEWDDGTTRKHGKRYAIISGDTDPEMRDKIQKVASSRENIYADIIRLVLVGPAGAEGIEFKNFRYAIICDPFFNAVRTDQVENRIDRFKSHEMLPPKERTVQTFYLLIDYPEEVDRKKITEPTTDEYLYVQSKRRKLLSLEFYRLLIEASIDCPIHRDKLPKDRAAKIHCLMCAPTNRQLFTDRLDKDIKSVNPCHAPRVESIKAKEIIVETESGEKRYMYTETDNVYEFFEYRDELGGYLPVARNHPDYDLLMEAIH